MSFCELLWAGCKVEIKPFAESTKEFWPATFWLEGHTLVTENPEDTFRRRFDQPLQAGFEDHCKKMALEGFAVSVHK